MSGFSVPSPGSTRPIALWDTTTGERLAVLRWPSFTLSHVIFSRDRSMVAWSTNDDTSKQQVVQDCRVTVLEVPKLKERLRIPTEGAGMGYHAFSPDGELLAVSHLKARSTASIAFWHLGRGEELFRWSLPEPVRITGFQFTPEGDLCISEAVSPNLRILGVRELRRQLTDMGLAW